MDKQIISFFLASSITENSDDRINVGNFVNQLNNIYEPQNIFIKLFQCESETMDHTIKLSGSQKSLDELIEDSDLCFVIFWKKVGEYTVHELEVALESYKKNNNPKIVVYFKTVEKDESVTEEIKDMMNKIDLELLHYHREYSHIDSLKLGIITQLQVLGFIKATLSVEESQIKINNEKIISTDKIPLFVNNKEYADLIVKYNEVCKICKELQNQENNLSVLSYKKLIQALKQRDRIKEDIDEMAENIFNIGTSITQLTLNDNAVTERIRHAIKLFDEGDYDGVLEILNLDEIESSIKDIDAIESEVIKSRISIVEEYKLRILALEAQGKWKEVDDTYLKALEQVEGRVNMPKTIMYDYATFLQEQKEYNKSIQICEKLLKYYSIASVDSNTEEIAKIYNLLSIIFFNSNKYLEAEKYCIEALKLREQLAKNDDKFNIFVAETSSNLAELYFKTNKHVESEKLYLNALNIYKQKEDLVSEKTHCNIARTYINLGNLYYQMNRHEDAEKLYKEALLKFRELAKINCKLYDKDVAASCNKLAYLYSALISHRRTDKFFIEALEIKRSLSKEKSKIFYTYIHNLCENLADIYESKHYHNNAEILKAESIEIINKLSSGFYEDVEADALTEEEHAFYNKKVDDQYVQKLCFESLAIHQRLAKDNPQAYDSLVAKSMNSIAFFDVLIGYYIEAEAYYNETIAILTKLVEYNANAFEIDLAITYSNLGYLYYLLHQYDNAEQYYSMSINIYNKYSVNNDGAYDTDLARNYNFLASVYSSMHKKEEANLYFFKSLMIYIKIYQKSPKAYIDRVINTVGNIIYFLFYDNPKEIMDRLINF